jgi:hypothetical protein
MAHDLVFIPGSEVGAGIVMPRFHANGIVLVKFQIAVVFLVIVIVDKIRAFKTFARHLKNLVSK